MVTVFNDLWYQPALPALLEIAAATRRVRVGPSCLNPFTLHPVEIAGQIAALDRTSRGRAFLGLAAGAWLETLAVDSTRPVAAVREAWEIVRRLLSGDDSGFDGRRAFAPGGRAAAYEIERRGGAAARRHVGSAPGGVRRLGGGRAQGRRQREPGAGAGAARMERARRRSESSSAR